MAKIGVVLPGGGARGAWQVGAMRALTERGLLRDGVHYASCTSVGAINGLALAMFAPGSGQMLAALELLDEAWCSLQSSKSVWTYKFPPLFAGLWSLSVGNTSPLRSFIQKYADFRQIRTSGVKLRLTAVDILSGDLRVFTEADLDDRFSAVMASSAFPVAFPPEEIDGALYLDGGLRDIAPVGAAIEAGSTEVFVLALRDPSMANPWPRERFRSILDVGIRSIDLLEQEIIANDVKMARLYNRLVTAGVARDKRIVSIRVFSPTKPLGTPLVFDPERIRAEIRQGYEDVISALDK